MADDPGKRFPDVFADAVSIGANPYGVALTFLLSEPTIDGSNVPPTVSARVRLTPELAKALGDALTASTKGGKAKQG